MEGDDDLFEALVPLRDGGVGVAATVGCGQVDVVRERREQCSGIEPLGAHDVDLDADDDAEGGEEDPGQQAEDDGEGAVGDGGVPDHTLDVGRPEDLQKLPDDRREDGAG